LCKVLSSAGRSLAVCAATCLATPPALAATALASASCFSPREIGAALLLALELGFLQRTQLGVAPLFLGAQSLLLPRR
jgi:ABC-type nitrate/sulfonate/bicarbonate transport system substrate-binding protein